MQRNPVLKSLENSVPKEFLDILKDSSSFEEKMMAIYLKALKPEFFSHYKPVRLPSCPPGWVEEYQVYASVKPSEKSSVWREMIPKFGGYMKAVENAKAENLSNKYFLTEMSKFFEDKNMPIQSAQITQRLIEFEALGVA